MTDVFLKGSAIGFMVAAPVGPIGILCIQRSVVGGRIAGFVSGLGAATADALYGLAAAAGMGAFARVLIGQRTLLQVGGGAVMVALGIRMLRTPPPGPQPRAPSAVGLAGAYLSTLGLTLANPMTLLSFAGIFAGFGVASSAGGAHVAALVAGVLAGSSAWWLLLSSVTGLVRRHIDDGSLRVINLAGGTAVAGFGAWCAWQGIAAG